LPQPAQANFGDDVSVCDTAYPLYDK
jgi:hypothetical protein